MAVMELSGPLTGDQPRDSDEALMLAFADGDHAAFERLYHRHRQPLFRFMMRAVTDRSVAEQLFQDVWFRIVDARLRYRPEAKFQTYLYRVAHNRVVDHYRRARNVHELTVAVTPEPATDQPGPDQRVDAQVCGEDIQRAIAALPVEQRAALLLQIDGGLSLQEIAAISGAGRETIKSRLRYANDKLRKTLRGWHD